MTPGVALHAVMVRELEALGEATDRTALARRLGVSRGWVSQVAHGRRVSQDVLADWCTRWEAAGYPALSYLVGRDWCWAGRADEVPVEVMELREGEQRT